MPIADLNIDHLPSEVLLTIFEYLSVSDRKCVTRVNHRWNTLINQLNYLKNDSSMVITNSKFNSSTSIATFNDLAHLFKRSLVKIRSIIIEDDVSLGPGLSRLWDAVADTLSEVKFVRCNNID